MATKSPMKHTAAHEKGEAKALKSGKTSIPAYLAREKSEGEKGSKPVATALKSGKMSPAAYAKREKGGK